MFEVLKAWFFKYFGEAEAAILLLVLILGAIVIWLFGKILAPLFAGIIIAYLLEGVITPLQRYLKFPRALAVTTVFILFIGLIVVALIGLIPTFAHQLTQFATQIPNNLSTFSSFLTDLSNKYPHFLPPNMVENLINGTNVNLSILTNFGNNFVANSLASLSTLITWIVYIFMVPLLTFFILKDKSSLLSGAEEFMPEHRGLIMEVWYEMKQLLGRYVRGKALEVTIVTIATWGAFAIFKLNYAFLLAFLTGLSAILPYIGLIIVTVPVTAAALLQFGLEPTFFYVMLAYGIIQILDSNVLVPLLFSEAMNLNPVIIITAVLLFGSLWGFWGLFFAIPLATLVKAVIKAWVRHANRNVAHIDSEYRQDL
jgi:putative permease